MTMNRSNKKKKVIPDEDVTDVLIYCRVSSKSQEIDGSGLHSQEARCVEKINREGWKMEKVFHDTITGGGDFMARPAMRALIKYIDERPHKRFIVLFDDLKRFARDTEFHLKLRTALRAREVIPQCLNYNFDDSPEGVFVETVLAASNELDRKQNRRQVIQKMQGCFLDGYYAFTAPIGYSKKKVVGHNHKLCVPNEFADVVKEALEGFSTLKFVHRIDVVRFLQEKGVISKKQSANKAIAVVDHLLTSVFFVGDLEYEKWDVVRKKGMHEGIIDYTTYDKNQKRLNSKATTFTRQDIRDDFELRGLVNCSHCSSILTGSPSTGKKGKKYNYYKCTDIQCVDYGKSISAEFLHTSFFEILKDVKASDEIISLALGIFEDVWDTEIKGKTKTKDLAIRELKSVEEKIAQITGRITKTDKEILIQEYENQIERLAKEKSELQSFINGEYDYAIPYRTSSEEVLNVLKNPYSVWNNYDVRQKQRFFAFVFEGNLHFSRNEGYRTPKYSLPLTVFEMISGDEPALVHPPGLEPRTTVPKTVMISTSPWVHLCASSYAHEGENATVFC